MTTAAQVQGRGPAAGAPLKGSIPSEVAVIGLMATILIVLFSPIPPGLLDVLLVSNISFSLILLLLTFYMDKPLAFSTFPSVLLMATLFRLSLNVAATRLILGNAEAGEVIDAIGSLVIAGNYVVGLVVFSILVVVQFVVVTNGAQRVAEVAARFTLDAMPGKQMSIDADLNMGIINQEEARERRRAIEQEANFYGAMDGASKFVKGDAIAGIIIILINIIGGLSIGMVQRDMGWDEALQTYALLTVGDGIVTQIPALIIATGTGIIVTRAATDAQLSREMVQQVASQPKILTLVLGALFIALFLPGVPIAPVAIILVLVAVATFFVFRRRAADRGSPDAQLTEEDLYSEMSVDPVLIRVGTSLAGSFDGESATFQNRLKVFRKQFALEMGLVLPPVRIREDVKFSANKYEVSFYGNRIAEGALHMERLLAIDPGSVNRTIEGIEAKDPAFGLPARWIEDDFSKDARDAGYTVVDPTTVLVTHLAEVVRGQSGQVLSRSETEKLVNRVRESQPTLVEEVVPKPLSMVDVQKVLAGLLSEKVSIRSMEQILETLADAGRETQEIELLQERVRERLGAQIIQPLIGKDGTLQVLTLDAGAERTLLDTDEAGMSVVTPVQLDGLIRSLRRQIEAMLKSNLQPTLLCSPSARRVLKKWVHASVPQANIISSREIPASVSVRVFATINW